MALNFPSSPLTGQTHFDGAKYWTWTGVAWKVSNIVTTQKPNLARVDGQSAASTDTAIVAELTKQTTVLDGYTLNNATLTGTIDASAATIDAPTLTGTIDASAATIDAPTLTGTIDASAATINDVTLSKAVLNDGYTEEVFAITDGATVNLDPNNGSIQTWTLGASRTPGQANWAAGQSMTLMIDDGSAFTVTWTSIPVTWVGGTAPTLATTGFTVIQLWKVGTTIYGALTGSVA